MPYIPLELDALNAAPDAARLAGITDDAAIAGLVRLWARVLRTGRDSVTTPQIAGLFGGEGPRVATALTEFGFQEQADDEWRVKGSDRLIGVASARSRGGHAAKSNLIPGARHRPKTSSALKSPEILSAQPINPLGSPSALSPNLQTSKPPKHQDEEDLRADARPPPPEPFELQPTNGDPRPRKRSEAQEFFDCARSELQRVKGKLPEAELDPPVLNRWFAPAVAEVGLERLWAAFCAWVLKPRDDFWAKRNWPFRGFMKVWRDYVPREVPREIADAVE